MTVSWSRSPMRRMVMLAPIWHRCALRPRCSRSERRWTRSIWRTIPLTLRSLTHWLSPMRISGKSCSITFIKGKLANSYHCFFELRCAKCEIFSVYQLLVTARKYHKMDFFFWKSKKKSKKVQSHFCSYLFVFMRPQTF